METIPDTRYTYDFSLEKHFLDSLAEDEDYLAKQAAADVEMFRNADRGQSLQGNTAPVAMSELLSFDEDPVPTTVSAVSAVSGDVEIGASPPLSPSSRSSGRPSSGHKAVAERTLGDSGRSSSLDQINARTVSVDDLDPRELATFVHCCDLGQKAQLVKQGIGVRGADVSKVSAYVELFNTLTMKGHAHSRVAFTLECTEDAGEADGILANYNSLCELGFDERRVEDALRECRTDLNRAISCLARPPAS